MNNYSFNIGSNGLIDPLLNPQSAPNYYSDIEANLQELQNQRNAIIQRELQMKGLVKGAPSAISLWSTIDSEINTLSDTQKEMLFNDEDYNKYNSELNILLQEELINLVKPKVENSERGRKLLENQLNIVKAKKEIIVKQSNQEVELFNKFKIASKANPQLSYAEFLESIK